MKKMIITLFVMLTMAVQTTVAMSYEQARNEALFLTDKMAYELNLTDAQYEAAYEINLDYLMSVTGYNDVNGICWERRNADLRFILYSWQWDAFCAATYFFRPLYWDAGYWHFGVYARYPRRDYFYFGRPHFYASYRGGHSWRMNGGHSYYEHRRDYFRPGNVHRDHHVGMRNGFDRGDYRGVGHGNSSTRVTVGGHHNDSHHNDGHHNSGNWRNNGSNHGTPGNHDNSGNRGNNRNYGNHGNDSHSYGNHGNDSHNNGNHSSGSFNGGRSNGSSSTPSSGSVGGSRNSGSSTHSSGSFSGGRSSGSSSHSGGSVGSGRSSGSSSHSSGSFSGSRSSSSHSGSNSSSSRSSSHRR